MSVPDLQLGIEFCEQAFPLHLIADEDLKVRHVSRGLKKLIVDIELGQNFQNYMVEENEPARLDAEDIQNRMDDSFVFKIKKNPDFRLHSGFYPVGNGSFLLVFSPIISNTNDIKRFALNFDDFARHDPILNHISVVQTKDSTFNDIRALADRLEVQVEERTKELSKSMNVAVLANRTKSEIMANMSHELRTPLNAIIGFSSTMIAETFGPINDKYSEYALDIATSGNHLLELINDILDVSAIEVGKLELHEESLIVGEIITASIHMVRERAIEGKVKLITTVADDLPMLFADKRRIMQVFLNILSNAIKFTLPGGKVVLTASLDDNDGYVFTLTDTGIGMTPEEQVKAMSKFGQVDSGLNRKHEGTGLGLPLTLGLIEIHGGTFEIASEKGKGTSITICFAPERTVLS